MQNLILKTKGLARHLGLPTRLNGLSRSTFKRALFLLVTMILIDGTITAQNTKETKQVEELITEGQRLVKEGSAASLTKAIEKFEKARILVHSLNNVADEAALLGVIGTLYHQLGQHQKAIENYEQSLPLFRAAGDRKKEAISLIHLATVQLTLGESQKALDNVSQAMLLLRTVEDREAKAGALVLLSSVYCRLGQCNESLSYLNEALELSRAMGFREMEAVVLASLGVLYNNRGETQKARESFEQVLSVSRAAGFSYLEVNALIGLGYTYNILDKQKAREYFEQALPLVRGVHSSSLKSLVLHGLCENHINSRDYEKGCDYCAEALTLLRTNGHLQQEADTLMLLAYGEYKRGNLAASQAAIESAILIIELLRTKVINLAFRVSYFAIAQYSYYEFYIKLLMLLHEQHPTEGYDGKALQASERARARFLLETLTEVNVDIRQGVDVPLLERERQIQRQLNARAQTQMQMQLLSQPPSETQAKAIAKEIQTLINDLRQVETEIRQTSPRYAALTQPRPLTLNEIQTEVLDQDTLLLEYSLGGERSYLWLVTSSSLTVHELPEGDKIEAAAAHFYDLLNTRNVLVKGETNKQRKVRIAKADGEIPFAAESLSQMVLAPVAEKLGNKRLIIVADGMLHSVPFGVLPVASGLPPSIDRQRGVTRPLIADHEIVNLPSASTLAVVRKEVSGRQIAPKSVVALADPVFMKNDERVKGAKVDNETLAHNESTKDRQLVKAAAEDTGVANDGLYVPRLPGTREEAKRIVAMVPPTEGRLVLDFDASRDTVTSADLSQYRYVHLSTHGFLNSVHPELSGVMFSLVNKRGEAQDGFLRAHELFNLKLPVEVVVLSACQTGRGKNVRGEGLVSFLTRGFMYAGTPRVVVSLWNVSDLGTTELMVRFYRGMLKKGMRPAAALRAAQLSLMNDKRWASPYYWAPFILQGEWR